VGSDIRGCQDDHGTARPAHPPLPHPGDRQRQLPLQEQLRNPDPSRKETTAHLTGSKNPASPKPGSNLRGKPGSALSGIQHGRLAALKTTATPELKQQWRDLFGKEPPPYNRRFLESRLGYRIQELAYGGLKPETLARLEKLGEQFDGGKVAVRRIRGDDKPIAGTRLIREFQGVEHTVTVLQDGYDYQGRPYQSLSAIARAITGTRWNGWVFFGLKNKRG
jgi:hypothetical protein